MSIEKQIIDNIEQKLDEYQQGSNTRTYNILIKNESHNLPVINISLNNTYLSPHNHRIKAQLESNKEKKESVNNDPYSDKAQNIIQKILEDTEEFDQLKKELEDLGQKEPGLITREGLLINGNTRCAALKKLKSEGSVGILICSDSAAILKEFEDQRPNYILPKGSVAQDMYALSQCDYILGPQVTTMSAWAAYLGNVKLAQIKSEMESIDFSSFRHLSRLEPFSPFS